MRSNKVSIVFISLFFIALSSCRNNNESRDEFEEEIGVEENSELQENQDLASTIQGVTILSRFAMELGAAEIPDLEEEQKKYTFFAPMNDAFTPFYDEEDNRVINIDSKDMISYHMVPGEYTISQLEDQLEKANDSMTLPTVLGEHIWISRENDRIMIRGKYGGKAEIRETLNASNGIVYIINEMLLPSEIEEQKTN